MENAFQNVNVLIKKRKIDLKNYFSLCNSNSVSSVEYNGNAICINHCNRTDNNLNVFIIHLIYAHLFPMDKPL